jgi:hypothetical protein
MANLLRTTLLLTLLAATSAHAADVRVTYLVDAKALKAGAPAGTALTFELHATGACSAPVASTVVSVEDVALLEIVKPIGVKAGPKPPKPMIEMRHVLTGVAPQPTFYLRVTGSGVVPAGGTCQLQHASIGNTAAVAPPVSCPPDSVVAGGACADTYENSLWEIPPAETVVIQKVKDGTATLADLTGAGAVQVGCTTPPDNHAAIPATFPLTGIYTAPIYAASVTGVRASGCVSAPQAIAACTLSTKHLMSNDEWDTAAQGTPSHVPDGGLTECNTSFVYEPIPVASRSSCVSTAGAYDMVGNLMEWTRGPGTWVRGGAWGEGLAAGVIFGHTGFYPTDQVGYIGFRCAR